MAELRFVFRFSAKAKCRLGPGRDDRGALVFVLLLALGLRVSILKTSVITKCVSISNRIASPIVLQLLRILSSTAVRSGRPVHFLL